jgi:creatinine amidohydrolase/Fe(II)-dependent formamide hydrolase-like protein
VRELNLNYPDVKVIFSSAGTLASGTGAVEDMHAGASETSRMLAVAPNLVKDERPDWVPSEGREFLDYVGMRKVSPTGVWGRASLANLEEGERMLEESVERIVAYVQETFRRLEEMESGN